jgi:hypothetical protein
MRLIYAQYGEIGGLTKTRAELNQAAKLSGRWGPPQARKLKLTECEGEVPRQDVHLAVGHLFRDRRLRLGWIENVNVLSLWRQVHAEQGTVRQIQSVSQRIHGSVCVVQPLQSALAGTLAVVRRAIWSEQAFVVFRQLV